MNDEPKSPARIGQGMDYGEQADVQQVHAAVQRENANRASVPNRSRFG